MQDRLVAACDLGLVEGGVGGEQRFVVRLGARVEERAADADGGVNVAGTTVWDCSRTAVQSSSARPWTS